MLVKQGMSPRLLLSVPHTQSQLATRAHSPTIVNLIHNREPEHLLLVFMHLLLRAAAAQHVLGVLCCATNRTPPPFQHLNIPAQCLTSYCLPQQPSSVLVKRGMSLRLWMAQPMYRLNHTAVMNAMSATINSAENVKLPCRGRQPARAHHTHHVTADTSILVLSTQIDIVLLRIIALRRGTRTALAVQMHWSVLLCCHLRLPSMHTGTQPLSNSKRRNC